MGLKLPKYKPICMAAKITAQWLNYSIAEWFNAKFFVSEFRSLHHKSFILFLFQASPFEGNSILTEVLYFLLFLFVPFQKLRQKKDLNISCYRFCVFGNGKNGYRQGSNFFILPILYRYVTAFFPVCYRFITGSLPLCYRWLLVAAAVLN